MHTKQILYPLVAATILITPLHGLKSAPEEALVLEQLAQCLENIAKTPASPFFLKPSTVIATLKEIPGALTSQDDTTRVYQIQSATQGGNECWIYGTRNPLFMAQLFLAQDKAEIKKLYEAMVNPVFAENFATRIYSLKTVTMYGQAGPLYQLNADKQGAIPEHNKDFIFDDKELPANTPLITPKAYPSLFAYAFFNTLESTDTPNKLMPLIKDREKIKDDSLLLQYADDVLMCAKNSIVFDLLEKLATDDSFTFISFFFNENIGILHRAALIVAKEKNEKNNNDYFYLFADSLGGSPPENEIKRLNRLLKNPTYLSEIKLRTAVLASPQLSSIEQKKDDLPDLLNKSTQIWFSEPTPQSVKEIGQALTNLEDLYNNQLASQIASITVYYATIKKDLPTYNTLPIFQTYYKPFLNEFLPPKKKLYINLLSNANFPKFFTQLEEFAKKVAEHLDTTIKQKMIEKLEEDIKKTKNRIEQSKQDIKNNKYPKLAKNIVDALTIKLKNLDWEYGEIDLKIKQHRKTLKTITEETIPTIEKKYSDLLLKIQDIPNSF